jgi:hypothetical protein
VRRGLPRAVAGTAISRGYDGWNTASFDKVQLFLIKPNRVAQAAPLDPQHHPDGGEAQRYHGEMLAA